MAEPTLFDEASLALIASGGAGKDGKVYSIKPTDGTGDFTFSRGSNLAATRVGPDGLIEKGRENLLLQSNNFGTTWQTINASVTSGQSGYDGSSNAWELDATSAGGRVYQNISSSGVHTFSIYAKKGTADGVRVRFVQTTDTNVYIDLRDGTLSFNPTNTIDVDIQDVSNGWYRITFALNAIGMSILILYPTDGTSSQVAGSIYIQDSQLEIGLAATEVISSGATTGKAGLLEDEPRFDYSEGATCPSLLLEPSRTNWVEQSEYFSGSSWSSGSAILTNNAIVSPEGLQNATKVVPPNGDLNYNLRTNSNIYVSVGNYYTFSCFAKKGEFDKVQLDFSDSRFGQVNVSADLTNGTVIAGSDNFNEGIEDYGNGWYRIYVVGAALSSGSTARIIRFDENPTGDGTSGLYLWGAQYEQASYPTSYIPNHSGGTITRGADVCGDAGDVNTFNSTEGVLYLEASAIDNGSSEKGIALNDGGTNNRINIRILNNNIRAYGIVGGSLVCLMTYAAPSVTSINKIAFKYKENDFALWVNGVERVTDNSGAIFPANTLNELSFDYGGASAFFYGKVKQVLVFKEALSDTELIKLTTI